MQRDIYIPKNNQIHWTFSNRTLTLCALVCMWILMGFNNYNSDYYVYKQMFDITVINGFNPDGNIEIGYRILMYLFSKITRDYTFFLCIISFILIGSLILIIRLFTTQVFQVIVLYFIYGFSINAIQIRNFFAMNLFMIGLYFLLKKKCHRNLLLYIFFVVLASLFHRVMLFYLVLICINLNINKIYKISVFLSLGILFLRNPIVQFFSESKYNTYLSETNNISIYSGSNVLVLIYFVTNLFFVMYFYNQIKNNKAFALNILKINILITSSFFLVVLNNNFIRLIRNVFVMNYILFAIYAKNEITRTTVKNYIVILAYILYIYASFYFFIVRGSAFDTGFLALFRNNLIIEYLIH